VSRVQALGKRLGQTLRPVEQLEVAQRPRALDQQVVTSSAFAEAAGATMRRLVSLGRYALRSVRRPEELFTVDPDAA
jgi:adenylate cyclase